MLTGAVAPFGCGNLPLYEVVAGFDLAVNYKMINDEINIKIEKEAENLVKQLSVFRSSLRKK